MTRIWAHRGASGDAPENTIEAFELALTQGADGFELDVQRTTDGVLVVCHDEKIDRTSDGSGAIAAMSWDQLREFDFSNGMAEYAGAKIPTLEQVLELVVGNHLCINIELKNSVERYPGMEAEVVALVAKMGLEQQIWYSSFNHQSLVELVRVGANSGLGALYVEQLVRPWDYVTNFGVGALHPSFHTVTADLVANAHRVGVRVHPWTVNEAEHIKALGEIGVDAVITNYPALAKQVLSAC